MIPRCSGESGRKDRCAQQKWGMGFWGKGQEVMVGTAGCVHAEHLREGDEGEKPQLGLAIWAWATCPESSKERHVTGNTGLQDQGVMV